MVHHITQTSLVYKLLELVQAHRSAFKLEQPFWRAVGLVLGEVFSFGRHTITQELLALGLTDRDWSAWFIHFYTRNSKNCIGQE